ncbi:MAG TPA: ParA family protein [Thermoanaerobaculia bacterium]|nr:ParA family protein [Thermoanaerobaculia bacterium]
MLVLAQVNQKGGVGKTTVGFHIAHMAAELGRRTLVIDLDSQGNASTALSGRDDLLDTTGGADLLFTQASAAEIAPLPLSPTLHLLHGHRRLDAVEGTFNPQHAASLQRRLLHSLPYDVAIIDTPPTICRRMVAAMLWADVAVMPIEPASFSLAGLASTLQMLSSARKLNPGLSYRVVVNRFNKASKAQQGRLADVSQRVTVLPPYFTQRSAVAEAIEAGVPVWRYKKADRTLRELWSGFAREILQ